MIATTGNGDEMAKLGISVGDIGAGVYGAMGILAALYERQVTGEGKIVETSLFDALAEFMGYPAYYTLYGGKPPARAGVRHATVVPYGAYVCGDGNPVLFSVQTQKQWVDFCTHRLRAPGMDRRSPLRHHPASPRKPRHPGTADRGIVRALRPRRESTAASKPPTFPSAI